MSYRKRALSLTSAIVIGASVATAPAASAAESSLPSTDDAYGVPGSEQFMPLLEIPVLGPILYYTVALPVGMFIIGMYNLQNRMGSGSN